MELGLLIFQATHTYARRLIIVAATHATVARDEEAEDSCRDTHRSRRPQAAIFRTISERTIGTAAVAS